MHITVWSLVLGGRNLGGYLAESSMAVVQNQDEFSFSGVSSWVVLRKLGAHPVQVSCLSELQRSGRTWRWGERSRLAGPPRGDMSGWDFPCTILSLCGKQPNSLGSDSVGFPYFKKEKRGGAFSQLFQTRDHQDRFRFKYPTMVGGPWFLHGPVAHGRDNYI